MCGIFGYIGPRDAIPMVLEGIKRLEYRGYDSAGLAALSESALFSLRRVGKVAELEHALHDPKPSHLAIAHTRWATHGKPTEANAHPHFDAAKECAVVHNGIIENYEEVRRLLQKRGVVFLSETDTEVIPQLIGYLYKGDLLKAVQRALPLLRGAFAIAIVHKQHPHEIICAAKESPLAIGIGEGEMFLASDSQAFLKYTKKVIYLHTSEVARITIGSVEGFDAHATPIHLESFELDLDAEEVSKGKYQHYMLKEIFEQPQTVTNALLSRHSLELGKAFFDELTIPEEQLQALQRVEIVACGTSYHAGLIGSLMLEERARIPVEVEISSEFRYKNPIVHPDTLAIAISQSGETADTLAALHELKEKGASIIGLCNVQGSSIARSVDSCLLLRAGPEIGVASTKAYTSQLVVLALLTLRLARMRMMSKKEGREFIEALTHLPDQLRRVLDTHEKVRAVAKKYAHYDNFFFLGRRYMFPTALEGALKLKEIAYINANGYPAGEMKHGPIALINPECPTVAYLADSVTYPKMLSNLMEVKAREGKILAIAPEGATGLEEVADDILWVPPTIDEIASIPSTVISQLFAYYVALERGTEIDQPRNLAKSVTVE